MFFEQVCKLSAFFGDETDQGTTTPRWFFEAHWQDDTPIYALQTHDRVRVAFCEGGREEDVSYMGMFNEVVGIPNLSGDIFEALSQAVAEFCPPTEEEKLQESWDRELRRLKIQWLDTLQALHRSASRDPSSGGYHYCVTSDADVATQAKKRVDDHQASTLEQWKKTRQREVELLALWPFGPPFWTR